MSTEQWYDIFLPTKIGFGAFTGGSIRKDSYVNVTWDSAKTTLSQALLKWSAHSWRAVGSISAMEARIYVNDVVVSTAGWGYATKGCLTKGNPLGLNIGYHLRNGRNKFSLELVRSWEVAASGIDAISARLVCQFEGVEPVVEPLPPPPPPEVPPTAPPEVVPPPEAPPEIKCFIVTACFDSLKVAQVQRLRTFRDSCLPKHVTRLYYRVSPPIARFLRKHETLRVSARNLIERLLLSPIRVYNKPTIKLRKDPKNPTRLEILGENVLDAFIDGCIAGLMTGWLVNPDIGWKVALGVGLLKFFIRLKELRGK